MKKYKLTEETLEHKGRILYRIEALKDFGSVRKGDKGGFVESEKNLSHNSDCWVGDNAKVYDNAQVYGNVKIYGNAEVYGNAQVWGSAKVLDNVKIYDYAVVHNNANVYGNAHVYGNADVYGYAMVYGNAMAYGSAKIYGNAEVYGYVVVSGNEEISGDAKVGDICDYIVFKNWWSSGRYLTWTRSNNKWKVGCFYGTGEELVERAYKNSELSGREYKWLVDYVESILQNKKGGEK